MRQIEPILEVYFDPTGMLAGIQGCYCAHLQGIDHLTGAGMTPAMAVHDVVKTIVSYSDMSQYSHLPKDPAAYRKVRLDAHYFEPLDIPWDQEEDNSKRKPKDTQQVAEIVNYMMTPRRYV